MKLDQQQKQLKKRRFKRWLTWLRKPETLRLLFQLGIATFNLLKWLIELFKD